MSPLITWTWVREHASLHITPYDLAPYDRAPHGTDAVRGFCKYLPSRALSQNTGLYTHTTDTPPTLLVAGTLDALADAVNAFKGAIVLVSHNQVWGTLVLQ